MPLDQLPTSFLYIPPLPQANWALLVLIPQGWACVHCKTLRVSPTNSPVRLGVSPTTSTPTGFFQSEVLRLFFPTLELWVAWSVSLPSCSSQFLHMQMWDHLLLQPPPCQIHQLLPCLPRSSSHFLATSPLCQLLISAPLTCLDECFFFNSLVVGLPYSSIFWQFCFLFLNLLLLFFFLLCEEAKGIYLFSHLGQKSRNLYFQCNSY